MEDTWIGGSPEKVQEFNQVFEDRVRTELKQLGLLDLDADDEVLVNIQKVCFKIFLHHFTSLPLMVEICC